VNRVLTAAACLLVLVLVTAEPRPGDSSMLTPYALSDKGFLRGATLDPDTAGSLADRLRVMRDDCYIETAGFYHLPGDALQTLRQLKMRAAVRLEAYDPDTFAFDNADADRLLERYRSTLETVAAQPDAVAYVTVNMPLDDPRVQRRLGGTDSAESHRRQVSFAAEAVSLVRRATRDRVPVYLNVFYGWDNGFHPPSYASAGADGYVLTSYSYPGATVAGRNASDAELIDEPRRRETMRRFLSQYGPAPVIVEYGIHTAEHHGPLSEPAQTAGLVADRVAKRRALRATTRFYRLQYPSVRGTVYFGFDVYKAEGDPPAELDFGLDR
jgi:hypothetical protein